MRTDEAVPPAHLFEVFGAGGIAREEPLKLPQRPRKRQPRVLIDVHENQRGRFHTRSPLSGNRVQGIAPIASGFRPYSQTNTTPGGCMRKPDKHCLKMSPTTLQLNIKKGLIVKNCETGKYEWLQEVTGTREIEPKEIIMEEKRLDIEPPQSNTVCFEPALLLIPPYIGCVQIEYQPIKIDADDFMALCESDEPEFHPEPVMSSGPPLPKLNSQWLVSRKPFRKY